MSMKLVGYDEVIKAYPVLLHRGSSEGLWKAAKSHPGALKSLRAMPQTLMRYAGLQDVSTPMRLMARKYAILAGLLLMRAQNPIQNKQRPK